MIIPNHDESICAIFNIKMGSIATIHNSNDYKLKTQKSLSCQINVLLASEMYRVYWHVNKHCNRKSIFINDYNFYIAPT